mgnify:FL=1
MITVNDKNENRLIRHKRVRKNLSGTKQRPRFNVYRSLNHIYVQIINDEKGETLVSCSTLDKEVAPKIAGKSKSEAAKIVGEVAGERAKAKKIKEVVFDRGGYLYTGRVKQVADGARSAGLKF